MYNNTKRELQFLFRTLNENVFYNQFLTRQSQADGIRLAQEKGVKFGRPKAISKEEFQSLYTQVALGKLSRKEACEQAGICSATFRRYEKEYIG